MGPAGAEASAAPAGAKGVETKAWGVRAGRCAGVRRALGAARTMRLPIPVGSGIPAAQTVMSCASVAASSRVTIFRDTRCAAACELASVSVSGAGRAPPAAGTA
eukprot:scaffold26835_cov107-Isochrysis_galbana.AAC.5